MKIKDISYKSGNDFKAVFVCPLCGEEYEAWGYSDAFFYNTVMPNATCRECKKNEQGEEEHETVARMGCAYRI